MSSGSLSRCYLLLFFVVTVFFCGADDPRIRPWYVAASSGPKDVVIVLDVSGSMSQYGRLDLAKEAAETVINTL